ncbi:MAG: hypothetical protein WAT79_06205 [Saprospiraceae bacterium]
MEVDIQIKVNGIYHLTDARYFAAHEVNYLGFCIDEDQPNHCSVQKIKEIVSWLEGPTYVLETNQPLSMDKIVFYMEETGISFFHLGKEVVDFPILPQITYFKDVLISQLSNKTLNDIHFPVILIEDLENSLNKNTIDMLQSFCRTKTCFLDIPNHNPDDLIMVAQQIKASGLIFHGGDEEKTGIKNYDVMDEFFERLDS